MSDDELDLSSLSNSSSRCTTISTTGWRRDRRGHQHPPRPGLGGQRVLNEALVEGMRIVGIDFRDGILFVPEVLLAANAMKAGMEILRPLLAETGAETIGKVVIGTVKGDIHDIGKNLVGMMLEGAGFEVFDLGINTDADEFIAALEEHNPDILGMSALLTTTMPYMKVVIDTLESGHPRQVHRAGGRRSPQRGVRPGGRRRRLLPRRRHRLGNRRSWCWHDDWPPGRTDDAGRDVGSDGHRADGVYVLACGALARELTSIVSVNGLDRIRSSTCRPAPQHPRSDPGTGRRAADGRRRHPTPSASSPTPTAAPVGCSTRCSNAMGSNVPGAHCYEFFSGELFHRLQDREPGHVLPHRLPHPPLRPTRLGRDSASTEHPQLRDMYFGNYRRLVYLSQTHDPAGAEGEAAADRLGLTFEHHHVGLGALEPAVVSITRRKDVA
jgi:methylmalonyl-CoA mutase cobalamin-binding subunit